MPLIKWKDEDAMPSCENFKQAPEGIINPEREAQVLVCQEYCVRRSGLICIHAQECKNWNPFECMISKKGWEAHLAGKGKENIQYKTGDLTKIVRDS